MRMGRKKEKKILSIGQSSLLIKGGKSRSRKFKISKLMASKEWEIFELRTVRDKTDLNKKDVIIICPKCQTQKKVQIPSNLLVEKSLITINIPSNTICEHYFQAFLDKSFKVRGYQKVDYQLES